MQKRGASLFLRDAFLIEQELTERTEKNLRELCLLLLKLDFYFHHYEKDLPAELRRNHRVSPKKIFSANLGVFGVSRRKRCLLFLPQLFCRLPRNLCVIRKIEFAPQRNQGFSAVAPEPTRKIG